MRPGRVNVFVPSAVAALQPWVDAGVFGAAEVHATAAVADHLVAGDGSLWPDERVVLAYALAVRGPLHGHSCVELDSVAGVVDAEVSVAAADDPAGDPAGLGSGPVITLPWPDLRSWLGILRDSRAVRVVDSVDEATHLDERPLVLNGQRLYTQRQWVDECVVAVALRRLAAAGSDDALAGRVDDDLLDRLLGPPGPPSNPQRLAATRAIASRLTVIVGGPGTGKTYTIACLLAALLAADLSDGRPALRIGLAAPTGKAAARMTEAVVDVARQGVANRSLPAAVAEHLADLSAVTVHRLLGPRPDHRTRFKHGAGNPLPYDVVVVDETSMVPLPMMARLLEAVSDTCRLVLVGDPDQLESIDVGAVIGDVVRAAEPAAAPLHENVIRLTSQHRTEVSSPIGPLAEAIRRGEAADVLAQLRRVDDSSLVFVEVAEVVEAGEVAEVGRELADQLLADDAVRTAVGPAFAAARAAALDGDGIAALAAVSVARVLCAHRQGPAGIGAWNRHVESWLLEEPSRRGDYPGRAILATRNDPRTGIVNGDTGAIVRRSRPDGECGTLRAVFRHGEVLRDFAPAELDDLETAFAITVHKSQGSEYETVVVIHPPAGSPLIGRELLYTAVTRASRHLVIIGSAESIRRAVESPARRVTGLTDALR